MHGRCTQKVTPSAPRAMQCKPFSSQLHLTIQKNIRQVRLCRDREISATGRSAPAADLGRCVLRVLVWSVVFLYPEGSEERKAVGFGTSCKDQCRLLFSKDDGLRASMISH